jgi:hypothetical protein
MTIETTSQTFELDPVADVVVTAIERDETRGDYCRDIRFFAEAAVEGEAPSAIVFAVRIRAAAAADLHITVPESEF